MLVKYYLEKGTCNFFNQESYKENDVNILGVAVNDQLGTQSRCLLPVQDQF